jgi:hypothetical protein
MRILAPRDFTTMPWKNGGGVTHEIARSEEDGRLLWRLSIAEVASDGPFSAFPGLMRVLTVIEGAGMVLETPEGDISARPFAPVRFSGDVPVTGRLVAGPVRDFNLIFDPARIAGDVVSVPGPFDGTIQGAVLALGTGVTADGVPVPPGGVALEARGLTLSHGARALLATLKPA